jgi:hypothetical protein
MVPDISSASFFSLPPTCQLRQKIVNGKFMLRDKRVCQMAYVQTKNPDLGKFWRVLQWKMLVYFIMTIWPILRPFGIFWGNLVHCLVIWYIFSRFGMLSQDKSGSPAHEWVRLALLSWKRLARLATDFLSSKVLEGGVKPIFVQLHVRSRVARWYVFKPNIPIWVICRGSWNGLCWYIFGPKRKKVRAIQDDINVFFKIMFSSL